MTPGDQLLTVKQVAKLLVLSTRSVYNLPLRHVNLGPRSRRWFYSDVLAYAHDRTSQPAGHTAQAG